MTPTVTGVSERKTLDTRGAISSALVITYMVGDLGPFTLVTTQTDLASGKANQDMQAFASSLGTLPGVQG